MDFCDEVVAAELPFPTVGEADQVEEWALDEARREVEEERKHRVRDLQIAWDEEQIADPLLAEIAAARAERERADAVIRRLVAYGRQFARPRAYSLASLAGAAGMSVSGVRTCYAGADVAAVADNIGRRPVGGGRYESDEEFRDALEQEAEEQTAEEAYRHG